MVDVYMGLTKQNCLDGKKELKFTVNGTHQMKTLNAINGIELTPLVHI